MSVKFNKLLLLWCLGIAQPAAAKVLKAILQVIYPEETKFVKLGEVENCLKNWTEHDIATVVSREPHYYYSLTNKGDLLLPKEVRYNRDKTRLFLLKNASKRFRDRSGDKLRKLAGASPAVEGSKPLQMRRPKTLVVARDNQCYWSPLSKQLFAGSDNISPDLFLDLYTYPSWKEIENANSALPKTKNPYVSYLASAIGISSKLIAYMTYKKEDHYRSFEIGKRGGGTRNIDSPRVFLKTVQYWVRDYLFRDLKIHANCFSYQKGKSIISNAVPHVKKKYVANIDIKDFFGSITQDMVFSLFLARGFNSDLAKIVSKIVTYKNRLPQGAPTSPLVSNSYLYDFDNEALKVSSKTNLMYTRYADDITISGDDKKSIIETIKIIEKLLNKANLSLKKEKTRIASNSGQQRVTGLVVNEKAMPPRKYRKKIRAMFYNANKEPQNYKDRIDELKGHAAYLNAFSDFRNTDKIKSYLCVIEKMQKEKNE